MYYVQYKEKCEIRVFMIILKSACTLRQIFPKQKYKKNFNINECIIYFYALEFYIVSFGKLRTLLRFIEILDFKEKKCLK